MDHYISFLFTAYEPDPIKGLETRLSDVGIASEYSEFRPAIPQLKHSYSVVVRVSPAEADDMRERIEMVLCGMPDRSKLKMTEAEVRMMRHDKGRREDSPPLLH